MRRNRQSLFAAEAALFPEHLPRQSIMNVKFQARRSNLISEQSGPSTS
jgi:hypothetical protein